MLLYLEATNQVVSAALVAQREVDEEAVATTGPDAGKTGHPAEPDAIRNGARATK